VRPSISHEAIKQCGGRGSGQQPYVGTVHALIKPYFQKAQEAGQPACVEATNEHARDVSAHFGFQVVERIVIGEGIADLTGNLVPGGDGIRIYGMIAGSRV
jgi:hypothetical protein